MSRRWEWWRRPLAAVAIAAVAAGLAAGSGGGAPVASGLGGAGGARVTPAAPVAIGATELAATQTVVVNGTAQGPVFGGIGAVSGGGGNTRYLLDYPPAERQAILDGLFTPGRGASLQLLKLEIGGGGNSSDGAEPSVEPVPGQVNCASDYEFWLARQAVARNPSIRLFGLQWTAPSWVHGSSGLWTSADIRYLLTWLGCARSAGLHISYLGGWNEHYPVGPSALLTHAQRWFEQLRAALDANGYRSVQLVASDAPGYSNTHVWDIAQQVDTMPALAKAVAVVGVHDVCGKDSVALTCTASIYARRLESAGVPVWQSELGHLPIQATSPTGSGPPALARALVNEYVDAGITSAWLWPAVDAMPPGMLYEDRGLIQADHPWSGSYRVEPLLWIVAQTTDFTAPGWRMVRGAAGHLGSDGSSYVTYERADRSAWTMVVQTSTATAPEPLNVQLTGGLPTTVHAWMTVIGGSRHLVDLGTVPTAAGRWSFTLQPGAVYTFTSLPAPAGLGRVAPSPPLTALAPSYRPTADAAGMPALLAPMEGSFAERSGVVTQTTVHAPVGWAYCAGSAFPYAVVGSSAWRDYAVSARVHLPGTSSGAVLMARWAGDTSSTYCQPDADLFTVWATGAWSLTVSGAHPATLAYGQVPAASSYQLALQAVGGRLTASIDGTRVADVAASGPGQGLAGIGTTAFDPVSFTGLSVQPAG